MFACTSAATGIDKDNLRLRLKRNMLARSSKRNYEGTVLEIGSGSTTITALLVTAGMSDVDVWGRSNTGNQA